MCSATRRTAGNELIAVGRCRAVRIFGCTAARGGGIRFSSEVERPQDRPARTVIFHANRFGAGTGAGIYPSACELACVVESRANVGGDLFLHCSARRALFSRVAAEFSGTARGADGSAGNGVAVVWAFAFQ